MIQNEVVTRHFSAQHFDFLFRRAGAVGPRPHNDPEILLGNTQVEKPLQKRGIGIDQLPEQIRLSKVLTGNDLGMLGNVESLPSADQIREFVQSDIFRNILSSCHDNPEAVHSCAKKLLEEGRTAEALMTLIYFSGK